jgi:hypothetical protein
MILAQTEIAKLYDWLIPHVVEKHREHPNTSIEIIQSFSTGIGINSYAHCTGCGEKHEITDYGIW